MVPYLFASIPQSMLSVDWFFSSVGENAHHYTTHNYL